MYKIFFLIAVCFFLSSCSEPENTFEKPTNIEPDNISSQKKTSIEEFSSNTINKAAQIEKPISQDKNIDYNFAEPDSENNALFEDVIKRIAQSYNPIDFSSKASVNELENINVSCKKIDKKLASVTLDECLNSKLRATGFESKNKFPIMMTEFPPLENRKPLGKVLVIGGTHGDELTSISIVFKWISILQNYHSGLFHWHVAPLMNPDGALLKRATRPNANNVDLNRNMPTPDWYRSSSERWKKINNDPRKNPGSEPASEPETQWLIHEIETFKPDAIVSVHAPYGILDFDSPDLTTAPKSFGRLRLNLLGTYPGSLGNYAGISRDIPVLTLELPHSWVMPKSYEVNEIWTDMIRWLKVQLTHQ